MFILAPARFRETVTVATPDESAVGAFVTETFDLVFEAPSKPASEAFNEALKAAEGGLDAIRIQDDFMVARVVRWFDVVTETKAEVAYDAEIFASALHRPGVRQAVWDAFWRGLERARSGNSGASPSPSPTA